MSTPKEHTFRTITLTDPPYPREAGRHFMTEYTVYTATGDVDKFTWLCYCGCRSHRPAPRGRAIHRLNMHIAQGRTPIIDGKLFTQHEISIDILPKIRRHRLPEDKAESANR